jgi:hypothetical protein
MAEGRERVYVALSTCSPTLGRMGTRISVKGWTLNVDESVDEVKALLSDGEPHIVVPDTLFKGGDEVEREPVDVSIGDVLMLADNSL